jgi:hypothetical protein
MEVLVFRGEIELGLMPIVDGIYLSYRPRLQYLAVVYHRPVIHVLSHMLIQQSGFLYDPTDFKCIVAKDFSP